MTEFREFLAADAVLDRVTATTKKNLFQLIARELARRCNVSAAEIADALNQREKLGSTGFGSGVAIPHGRIEGLSHVTGLFVRLAQPLAYDAVDNLPVDLVFVLLSPKQASVSHLKALAQVSRAFRNRQFVDNLRGAMSVDALYALFATLETRSAA
ncbi:PTS sugar transporter subunit IIA [Aquisediminimonas sediminicola]|uniref:PTS sugar transporter subunit IIA n=1 Tax=Alteraquisediminimonas sediminicola TaxID=2676787 RepID=UPI001C8E3F3D|nr:PTS sugar transporter subunit IIA [Aquisediminimonas sediminicola]